MTALLKARPFIPTRFLACLIALVLAAAPSGVARVPLAAAQGSPGDCEGGDPPNQCLIWAVDPNTPAAGSFVYSINVCNGVITTYGPFGPALYTAAARTPNGLYTGDPAGNVYFYPIPAGPPNPIGTMVINSMALSEGFTASLSNLWAGTDQFVVGGLYRPAIFIGAGVGAYGVLPGPPESDLVFDHTPGVVLPLMASVTSGGAFNLVNVSRGNGAQFFPRPFAPQVNVKGLAYDGFGRLWAAAGGFLYQVNPATGALTFTWMIPGGITDLASTPQCIPEEPVPQGDLGDAPDSTNHPNKQMTAYPAVGANFPTVYDVSTGAPEGPIHWVVQGDSWLGATVTQEVDADQLPDADGVTNIDPTNNIPDRDGADDGVAFPISLPQCQLTQFQFTLNVVGPVMNRYVNVWFDFNRNGQWGEQIQCTDPGTGQPATVNEWAVQDMLTNLGPGTHVLTTSQFRSLDVDDDIWMRISVAEGQAPNADGRGTVAGWEIGETEDYLLHNTTGSDYSP